MKTIKELADELGVSKTAIRNYMDADFRAKYTAKNSKGVITINQEGCKLVSENLAKYTGKSENKVAETTENSVSGDIIALLQTTIEVLREQLAEKDRQIAQLTRLAEQAQALHAGTMQQALPESCSAEPATPAEPAEPAEPAAPIEPSSKPKKKRWWHR